MFKIYITALLTAATLLSACEKPPVDEDNMLALDIKFPEPDDAYIDETFELGDGAARDARLAAEAAIAGGAPAASLMEAARSDPSLSTFVEATDVTGLSELIEISDSNTIFIPTNDAFARDLAPDVAAKVFNEDNRDELEYLLLEHTLDTDLTWKILSGQIAAGGGRYRISTARGTRLTFSREGGNIILSNDDGAKARLINEGMPRSDGVAYRLDGVLTSKVSGTR